MRILEHLAAIGVITFLVNPAAAQSPTSRRRPQPKSTHVIVRSVSGTPLDGVNVKISGTGGGETTTDAQGVATVALANGQYRLRFEREGFLTLEREVTIGSGQPAEIEVALNAAPPPPLQPPPPPPPPPPPTAVPVAVGPPVNVFIPAFLDKNFIGRDPLKESVLGCTPDATTRLLQLRDPLAAHTHTDLDEILYVVAGNGAVRIGDESTSVTPGALSVIPRGTPHAIERRGKNPLIVLSTLAGAPCLTPSTGLR